MMIGKPLGDRPMTGAERQSRYRDKLLRQALRENSHYQLLTLAPDGDGIKRPIIVNTNCIGSIQKDAAGRPRLAMTHGYEITVEEDFEYLLSILDVPFTGDVQ